MCSSTVVENSTPQVAGSCRCYPATDSSLPRLVTGMAPWSFGNSSTTHVHTETTDFAHAQETDSDTTRAQIAHGTLVRPLMYR